jgi:hypothetical protein
MGSCPQFSQKECLWPLRRVVAYLVIFQRVDERASPVWGSISLPRRQKEAPLLQDGRPNERKQIQGWRVDILSRGQTAWDRMDERKPPCCISARVLHFSGANQESRRCVTAGLPH